MYQIYFAHTRYHDYLTELYKPIRNSFLNTLYEITLPHENDIEFKSKEVIKKSNLIVAEVSFPSTGLGIELGWGEMLGVPIICIYKKGARITSALRFITNHFIEYENAEDMIRKLDCSIKEMIDISNS